MWLATLCAFFFLYCIYDCWKPKNYPPGPVWLPFVGCFPMFHRLRSKFKYNYLVFHEWARTYGPVLSVKLGNEKIVVISTYDLIKKTILQNEFNGRPDGFFYKMRSFGTLKGVSFTEGPHWSHNRKFALRLLRKFGDDQKSMEDRLMLEARALVKHVQELCMDGAVRMDDVFQIGVINSLWYTFAGHRFEYENTRANEMLDSVNESFRMIDAMGGLLNQMPFLRFFLPKVSGYNRLTQIYKKLWQFLNEEIEEHEKKLSYNDEPRDLIDTYLLKMHNNTEQTDIIFDHDSLLMLCLDLFMAGTNTTSDTLACAFLLLSLNSEYIKILQDELDSIVGRWRAPTEADLPSLPKTKAFLEEAQRYYNMTPLGILHRTTSDVFVNGYKIPKNTNVCFNMYSIHYDETLFDRPNEFRPQRFLDEQGHFLENRAHIPFGLGKRRCLGEKLARSTLFLFFSHVLHYFNLETSPYHEEPSWDLHEGLTLYPNPYYLKVSARSDFSKVFLES